MKKALAALTLLSVWVLVLLSPSPTKAAGSPYIIRGPANVNNIVASTVSEITSPTTSCAWVGSKGLTGGVNANYFKSDTTPVGWAGFGAGTVRDYGAGTLPATRTFVVRSSGSMSIVASSSLTNGSDLALAVSGRELEFNPGPHHRTVLGLKDGELILFVLPDATPDELVAYAQTLGLNNGNAIQLDGGGSSAFCQGSTPLFGGARQVPVSIGLKTGTITGTTNTGPSGQVKVMLLGDSITDGYACYFQETTGIPASNFLGLPVTGDTDGDGRPNPPHYPTVDCSDMLSSSYGGKQASEVATTYLSELRSFFNQADVVVIHLGTNDINSNRTPKDTKDSIQSIVTTIRNWTASTNSDIKIYVAKILPMRDKNVGPLNDRIGQEISGATIIDASAGLPVTISDDGVHPTIPNGYRNLARNIASQVFGGVTIPPTNTPPPTTGSPINTSASFGFNIHNLTQESQGVISSTLSQVAISCQSNIVRLWGYQSKDGINTLPKVLAGAPPGMQFIVALEDFPFGPAESNPREWFANGYRQSYRQYAIDMVNTFKSEPKILGWEIMNEPHCKGDGNCLPALEAFMADMSTALRSTGTTGFISPGLMMQIPESSYERITQMPNVTANSCHFYTSDPVTRDQCKTAASIVRSANKYFYIGEAGYKSDGPGDSGSCTSNSCTNVCSQSTLLTRAQQVQHDVDEFVSLGASAFLVWQYSPQQNQTLSCDPFSVFPTDPLCGGVIVIGEPEENAACTLPSDPSSGGSPFSLLRSFFGGIVGAVSGFISIPIAPDTDRCSDVLTSLHTAFPTSDTLPRYVGKILNCYPPETASVTIDANATTDVQYAIQPYNTPPPFGIEIPNNPGSISHGVDAYTNDTVQNYAVSPNTNDANAVYKETILGNWMGDRDVPKVQEEIMNRAERGDFASNDYETSMFHYKNTGFYDKMLPYMAISKCMASKQYKKRIDAEIDCTLAGVIAAYDCKINKNNCDKELYHDYPVAWVVPAEGSTTGATWYQTVPGPITRPFLVSEFICKNRSFEPVDVPGQTVKNICAVLYGDSLWQTGEIFYESNIVGSDIGTFYANHPDDWDVTLRSPADDALYGNKPAFRLNRRYPLEDIPLVVSEVVHLEDGDPDKGRVDPATGIALDAAKETRVAVPGVKAVAYIGAKLNQALSPYNAPKKEVPVVSTQCGNRDAVFGNVHDPIAGDGIPTTRLGILVTIRRSLADLPNILNRILNGSQAVSRGATVTLKMSKPFTDIYKEVAGPGGVMANYTDHDTQKLLQTKVGGTTINAAGMVGKVNCIDDLHCDTGAKIPFLGGGKITAAPDGVIPQLVTGIYTPGSGQTNSGRLLKQMAERFAEPEPIAQQVWQYLASFEIPENTSSDLSQN